MLHNIYIWNILGDQHSVSGLPTGPYQTFKKYT